MKDQKVKSQSITFIATYVMIQALNALIGFIVVSLVRPIWNAIFYKKSN